MAQLINMTTQRGKILNVLQNASGEWVNGRYFGRTMMITQYHTRIHELQKMGYEIEPSDFTDEYGFKSYRLVTAPPKVEEKYRKEIISPLKQANLFTGAKS